MSKSVFDSQTTYFIPLDYGLIALRGPDASKFLQGQVTCDVRELASDKTRLGAHCNNKGRMLLCFRALQPSAEEILLRVHKGLVEKGLASLGKYIVFSKAKLSDASDEYRCVGIVGPEAETLLRNIYGALPAGDGDWLAAGSGFVIRRSQHRFECWLQEAELAPLAKGLVAADHNLWRLLDIEAGLGDITPETYEAFTPQVINFQLVEGINFRKGCYTGQEIVARLHYRGTLKRHMYRFEYIGNDPLPGSELHNADGKPVGEVVLAATTGTGQGELLASVVDDERDNLYLPGQTQKLRLLSLPYAIPTPNDAD
jgi:tRNA-modifying protein YgfZ